jgi:hypothetical protein
LPSTGSCLLFHPGRNGLASRRAYSWKILVLMVLSNLLWFTHGRAVLVPSYESHSSCLSTLYAEAISIASIAACFTGLLIFFV